MLKQQFIDLLRCPETRRTLAMAEADLLARLNSAIVRGGVKNRMGHVLDKPLEEGLVRDDGEVLYPIHGDIPILLADEGISLNQLTPAA
jgi:uncharacterized protein YbaR (Trm112 family)